MTLKIKITWGFESLASHSDFLYLGLNITKKHTCLHQFMIWIFDKDNPTLEGSGSRPSLGIQVASSVNDNEAKHGQIPSRRKNMTGALENF
ncbi:uncharacterized protein EI90DRAFT_636050 [Cantharellus anzutake]|uniref:uncharacterized protein n=1 Tax=Cantharellus anzutake TaxID=1750568 RepID=UPI001907B40A|nr:uncharacterized protein EI90DRAFT_636050 [Cantharellus anzutake]KAF8333164.1 hypothetical protein EI90DRAFT_636050 [Cantharellus anzutake]